MKILLSTICIIFLLMAVAVFKVNRLKNVEYREPEFLSGKKK